MRRSRGIPGNSRSNSIHMLTEVKCAGSSRSRVRVSGPRNSGSSATTMGNSRMPLRVTATAASIKGAPLPSAEIRMTCAGAAQTRSEDSAIHHGVKPKSCASAPMPI